MYYTVYRVTNLINGKFYIGKHKTVDPNDVYMGSGKLIRQAITKYGKENFKKEILFIFDNEQDMNEKEKELVVISENSYNLCSGGNGGFDYINRMNIPKFKGKIHSEESKRKMGHPGNTFCKGKPQSEEHKRKRTAITKLKLTGKPKSEEHKRKISEALKKRAGMV